MFISHLKAAYKKDPSLKKGISFIEVFFYPGLWAIWIYRITHILYLLKIPIIPRFISQLARMILQIEIHPGAKIGKGLFIDHGIGIVIGETTIIGNGVMMYHGVTLGSTGWWSDKDQIKRHPTIEDNVIIGTGSTILGNIVIGRDSKVGANALVLEDVQPNSIVISKKAEYIIKNGINM